MSDPRERIFPERSFAVIINVAGVARVPVKYYTRGCGYKSLDRIDVTVIHEPKG